MIEAPEIVHTESTPAAVIHVTVPRSEIHAPVNSAIEEVMSTVTDQGIGPRGPMNRPLVARGDA